MCEDYPCCGHERGDCEGKLYGSDESIKARWLKGHLTDDEFDYYSDTNY